MSKKEDTKVQEENQEVQNKVQEENQEVQNQEQNTSDTPETDTPEVSNEEAKKEEDSQKKIDEIVQKRLERERKKFDEKLAEERKEAERMAQLSQEEKQKELDAKKKKEDEERERNLAIRENTLTAKEELQKAGVPAELVGYVVDPDPEKTLENTEQFIEKYNSSVSNSVQERLKGQPPKDISSSSNERKDRKVVTAF